MDPIFSLWFISAVFAAMERRAPESSGLPFWERDLDSFSDEIITRTLPPNPNDPSSCWYAVLDIGPERWPSDPDFSTGAATREEAVAKCARKIRDDQLGIGKFAPHKLDLWRLRKHWASKESSAR
jgi:hypothetical protein